MGLLTPGIGLLFWMFLTFLVLLFILGKFGWPVVLRMMKNREESIKQSLEAADKAKRSTGSSTNNICRKRDHKLRKIARYDGIEKRNSQSFDRNCGRLA